jgi:pyruvate formate lyase activating enzyme
VAAFASLDLVRDAGVEYEIRTTVHPLLASVDSLERLAVELAARGVERWVLQAFRATGCANVELVASAPHAAAIDPALAARLSRHVPGIEIRGAAVG